MNQVDWSYLKYPEHSYGRVLGRRKETLKMVARMKIISFDEIDPKKFKAVYQSSYFRICIGETSRMFNNNWCKMHGIPMRRKCR